MDIFVNINELDYGDYVKVNDSLYFVFDLDHMERTAELVPIEIFEQNAYGESVLSDNSTTFHVRQIVKVPPVKVEESVLRNLFRMNVMPWELVKQGLYPFSSVTGKFLVTEDDILSLINKLMESPCEIMIDAWQKNFSVSGLYTHASYPKKKIPGFSLAFLCEKILDVMDWYDPNEKDWSYIETLSSDYLNSKGKPISEIILPDEFKGDLLDDIEAYAKKNPVSDELRDYYINTLEELCSVHNPHELKRKGYAYYGGNDIVLCNWKKSEEALLALFESEMDDYVANSLGYIYYSDRLGKPDYEKAFYYFSYAAGNGVVEAIYKLSDMYRKGHGTAKNPEHAWKLLSELYAWCNKKKKAKGKYPDIMLRIGYCYRDGIGVDQNLEKAMECFYEAKEGIELRIKKHKGYGDEVVLKNVLKAISELKND